MKYGAFYYNFKNFLKKLNLNYHTSHDGRKTLRSELDRVGANKVCIDKILGHKSGDTGLDVYTKKSIEELIETIEMVDYRSKKNSKITYLNVS